MLSIRQNTGHSLPDWRNLGVLLRVLLGANLLALGAALIQAPRLSLWLEAFVENAAWLEPLLFLNLGILAASRDLLQRCAPRFAQTLAIALAGGTAALLWDALRFLGLDGGTSPHRAALLAAIGAGLLLLYFELRAQALAPRVEEARLQALNARIRPHFLFNALNTVTALIRHQPRQAETALEELAELFRALLQDPRELVPLSREIALGRQYLDLEKLRLGERLQVSWNVEQVPMDPLVPPLMLQPLLENAVHHGIEPCTGPGEIRIQVSMADGTLNLRISNPLPPTTSAREERGNHMALGNIRQRLALYYDMEARLEHGIRDGLYLVSIELPCRHPQPLKP